MHALYHGSGGHQDLVRALARIDRLGGTRRFWELDRLERYFHGNQHAGKASWWNGDIPVREREPCVISGLPRAAVEQAVRFTFGEGKFPDLRFTPNRDDDDRTIGGVDFGLSPDEAETLDALWSAMAEQVRIKINAREMLRRGLAMRTACGVYSLREGELAIELLNAKHCEATWDDYRKRRLAKLECRYIFPVEERDEKGKPVERWYWYRRVVDTERDTVYNVVPVAEGDEPVWTVDKEKSTEHNTGFCPAFWFPNLPRMDVGDDDGVALIDGLEDELDSIDYALSMRHTGALVYGSPQAWETGVGPHDGPEATGRVARNVDTFNTTDGTTLSFTTGPFTARKRSAHESWQYQASDVKLGLLEPNGSAADMVTKHVHDIRARILEAVQVVLVDPSEVVGRGDISAKLLELLYAPLLALVDDLRECWGSHLKALVSALLRFVHVHGSTDSRAVFLPGLDSALPILDRFAVEVEGDEIESGVRWVPPPCTLKWGPHFSPTARDARDAVEVAKAARGHESQNSGKGEALITRRTALRYIARHIGIEDLDAELEALDGEKTERDEKEKERAERELAGMHRAMAELNGNGNAEGAAKPSAGAVAASDKSKPSGIAPSGGPAIKPPTPSNGGGT